jgi:hypothetical protein
MTLSVISQAIESAIHAPRMLHCRKDSDDVNVTAVRLMKAVDQAKMAL